MPKGTADIYTQTVYSELNPLYANWEPSKPIALGDFGILNEKNFEYQGNITKRFGIKFHEVMSKGDDRKWFCSDEGYEMEGHAKGTYKLSGVLNTKALLELKFVNSDKVFFNAAGCSYRMIEDKVALGEKILKLYAKKTKPWKKEWVVVTDLVRAKSTTVIITKGKSSQAMLEATGDVAKINLADASVGFSMGKHKGVGYQVVAEANRDPLFGLSGIQPRFLWFGPEFGPKLTSKNSFEVTADLGTASPVWTRNRTADFSFGQLL